MTQINKLPIRYCTSCGKKMKVTEQETEYDFNTGKKVSTEYWAECLESYPIFVKSDLIKIRCSKNIIPFFITWKTSKDSEK